MHNKDMACVVIKSIVLHQAPLSPPGVTVPSRRVIGSANINSHFNRLYQTFFTDVNLNGLACKYRVIPVSEAYKRECDVVVPVTSQNKQVDIKMTPPDWPQDKPVAYLRLTLAPYQ